jgi:dTDP-glucose 4,6-dehydratase
MKYLVTGGAGFIGTNFINYLLDKYPDCSVVNLDKLTYAGNSASLEHLEATGRYKLVQGDICNPQTVRPLVDECDVIVNFAAESHVDRSITGPRAFVETNILGTQTLLDAALESKKRFHHISTDEVFGSLENDSQAKFSETTSYDPRSPYSASKAASDHLVRAYFHTFGLPVTITNCSNNYGPYQHPEKFIPNMVIKAIRSQPLPIYGTGENIRDWIHVKDHCAAVDLVVQKGKIGQTYLAGGDAEMKNIEVAKQILALLKKDDSLINFVKDRPGHDFRYAVDSSKIQKELGWQRQYSFEEGLKQTVDWYSKNEAWWMPMLVDSQKART